jgi:hypothetical protein
MKTKKNPKVDKVPFLPFLGDVTRDRRLHVEVRKLRRGSKSSFGVWLVKRRQSFRMDYTGDVFDCTWFARVLISCLSTSGARIGKVWVKS